MKRFDKISVLKLAIFLAGVVPLLLLLWRGLHDDLTANPIEYITRSTGFWTLTFLMTTLAITPLRRLLGLNWLIRFRRMFGLFAFFYGFLHLMTFVWLDKFFDVREMIHDIYKRPFITAGMTAFTLMLPLAVTSTAGWIRRLGGRRWQLLHRLVYFSGFAAVVHFWWLVKKDLTRPEIFATIFALLLGIRVAVWAMKRRTPVRAEAVSAD